MARTVARTAKRKIQHIRDTHTNAKRRDITTSHDYQPCHPNEAWDAYHANQHAILRNHGDGFVYIEVGSDILYALTTDEYVARSTRPKAMTVAATRH